MTTVRQLLHGKAKGDLIATSPDASVLEALKLMAEKNVGAVLVMEGDHLAGILSERDYARKVILLGRTSAETPVRDIMTSDVVTVSPDQTIDDCMGFMTDKRIRHLPVIEKGKVIGLISIGDVVKRVIDDQQKTIEDLQTFIRS